MKIKLYLFLTGALISGCVTGIEPKPEHVDTSDIANVNNNSDELSERIHYENTVLTVDNSQVSSVNYKSSSTETSAIEPAEHRWYLVADVSSPIFNGETLSASHVVVAGTKAYVSYHKQGPDYLGGVEVFDLANKAYPRIVSQALFEGTDVNAAAVDLQTRQKLWLALSHGNKGAVVRQIDLQSGKLNSSYRDLSLSKYATTGISASANGIVQAANYLFVSAGKTHGGMFTLDANTFAGLNVEEYSHSKSVAVTGQDDLAYVVTLAAGDEPALKVKQMGSENIATTVPIGGVRHQQVEWDDRGKSVVHFNTAWPDVAFVASGQNGMKGYSVLTGEELFSSLPSMLTLGNTNGITSDEDYIYLANGADGMSIALLPDVPGPLETVFSWDLDEPGASANFITTDGEWVFIAKGGKGLKILRKGFPGTHETLSDFDENGVPVAMETERVPVCSELLPTIYDTILPEEQDVRIHHPEYFDNTIREVELTKPSEVYVTFINEGAGYKNTLGYYYYHKDNPPQTVEDLNKVVIFPNASARAYGGDLLKGNTMKLLGEFEAGTVIGFYLISDGWDGFNITNGIYTQYTIPEFNISGVQQSLMFYEQNCGSLVMTFEDIALPEGDKDFNDSIFMISTSDPSAIDYSVFLQQ